jgi:dsDNA-specific endonuclease/ATPase MutS2
MAPTKLLLMTFRSTKEFDLGARANAGGKTVLLKSIGLAAQWRDVDCRFARAGSEVPFFTKIRRQSEIHRHASTFAAIQALGEGLSLSGPGSLILIDEICG